MNRCIEIARGAIAAMLLVVGAASAAGAATLLAQAEPALQPVSGDFATTANANVRELPQAGAKLVMTLPKGTVVQGVGKVADGSWHKVAFKGVPVGYISSSLLLALAGGASGSTAAAAPAVPAEKPAASSESTSNVPALPSASGTASTAESTAASTAETTTQSAGQSAGQTASSSASNIPGLPSADGGTQPATQQAAAPAPQPAAAPAPAPAPKVERYVANYRVWIYDQPQPNASRNGYYVEEQSFETYGESDDGQWLKVKRDDGSEGWVYRLQVRRPGETRSGRIKVEPSQGSIKLDSD